MPYTARTYNPIASLLLQGNRCWSLATNPGCSGRSDACSHGFFARGRKEPHVEAAPTSPKVSHKVDPAVSVDRTPTHQSLVSHETRGFSQGGCTTASPPSHEPRGDNNPFVIKPGGDRWVSHRLRGCLPWETSTASESNSVPGPVSVSDTFRFPSPRRTDFASVR